MPPGSNLTVRYTHSGDFTVIDMDRYEEHVTPPILDDMRAAQQRADEAANQLAGDPAGLNQLALRLHELSHNVQSPAENPLPVAQQSLSDDLNNFVQTGETARLQSGVSSLIHEIAARAGLDLSTVSGRLTALMHIFRWVTDSAGGRALTNAGHVALRNLVSVAPATILRLSIGHAIDLALRQKDVPELARTVMGAACMAIPVVGNLVNGVLDEINGTATPYSRATRIVMMGLSVLIGGGAVWTGTLVNPGLRFAEAVLYPLIRDPVQAWLPLSSQPNSAPTWCSLLSAGAAYSVNQLGVSRCFVALPDLNSTQTAMDVTGVVLRGLANAAGEGIDLYVLSYCNHWARHGFNSQPDLRIGCGRLHEELRSGRFWDSMCDRGIFVSSFNQLYDTLLTVLPKWMGDTFGAGHAEIAADWLTEVIALGATCATYPFWPESIHAGEYDLSDAEEGRCSRPPGESLPGIDAQSAGTPTLLTAMADAEFTAQSLRAGQNLTGSN